MPKETDAPRDIQIAEDQHTAYVELTEDESSPFSEVQKMDLFVFAMGYGFDQGLRVPIDGSKRALFNVSSMSDAQRWNFRAIAVQEKEDHSILRDKKQVYKIGREYANGGMEQLYKIYTRPGDTFSELSSELVRYGDKRLTE